MEKESLLLLPFLFSLLLNFTTFCTILFVRCTLCGPTEMLSTLCMPSLSMGSLIVLIQMLFTKELLVTFLGFRILTEITINCFGCMLPFVIISCTSATIIFLASFLLANVPVMPCMNTHVFVILAFEYETLFTFLAFETISYGVIYLMFVPFCSC